MKHLKLSIPFRKTSTEMPMNEWKAVPTLPPRIATKTVLAQFPLTKLSDIF